MRIEAGSRGPEIQGSKDQSTNNRSEFPICIQQKLKELLRPHPRKTYENDLFQMHLEWPSNIKQKGDAEKMKNKA